MILINHSLPLIFFVLKENPTNYLLLFSFAIIIVVKIFSSESITSKLGENNYGKERFSNSYNEDNYEKSNFNYYARFNDKNLMEALISLTITMLFKDRTDFPQKIAFIKKYFYKKFTSSYKYFPGIFTHRLKNHTTTESICKWINKRIPENQERINILYFLAGISMIDGSLSKKEHNFLIQIQELLKLEKKDLDSIIAMFTRHEEYKKEQNEQHSITNNERRTKAKIEIYCTILEIPSSSTFEEIKKAYRKLAMLNHPDKYEKAGKEMVNLANERFLKIQDAYEFLEKVHISKKTI